MRKNDKKIMTFILLMAFAITAVASADLAGWNAAVTASDPLNWYKLNETSGNFCADSAVDARQGEFSGVTLEQPDAFGTNAAAMFAPANESMIFFPDDGYIEGDWTAEYIVKKISQTGAQALHDGEDYSLRLEQYYTDFEVGFTYYYIETYFFIAEPGMGLNIPVDDWTHLVFTKNADGTKVYFNGTLVGTTANSVPLPRERIGSHVTLNYLAAYLDDVLAYDRALSVAEIATHAYAFDPAKFQPALLPEDFEVYGDTIALTNYWSTTGTSIAVETTEVYEANQSLKATFGPGGGTLTKDTGLVYDYTSEYDKNLVCWYKGNAGNVTLTLADDLGREIASRTSDAPMTSEWNAVRIFIVEDFQHDPNWINTGQIQITTSGEGTAYFDAIGFEIPVQIPEKVLHWGFDESSGKTVYDSVNGIDGTLSAHFVDADWLINGGHTGTDNALRITSTDPNCVVDANNITDPIFSDLCRPDRSWTINLWVYMDEFPVGNAVIGGFGRGEEIPNNPDYYQTMRYIYNLDYDQTISFWGSAMDLLTWDEWDLGKWQMVTATFDRWTQRVTLYKNAKSIGSRVRDLKAAFPRVAISPLGYDTDDVYGDPDSYFTGVIDDFSIWAGVLPQEDDDSDPTNDLLSMWGSWICPDETEPEFDLDVDCRVGIGDIAVLATQWLNCTRYPSSTCDG